MQGIESGLTKTAQAGQVEQPALAVGIAVAEGAQAGMLIEHLVCRAEIEPRITHALRHLAHDLPIGAGLARRAQKSTLARNPTLRTGDRAVFFAPSHGWQQDVGKGVGVGFFNDVGDHHQFAFG